MQSELQNVGVSAMTANYYDFYQKNPVFSSEFYSQFIRTLGKTHAQCADIGECFVTLHQIQDKEFNSWYKAWHDMAETVAEMGKESEQSGHVYSAGKAFLRAAEYHRASEFFLRANLEDPRIMVIYDQLQYCYERALHHLHPNAIKVRVPFDHHSLDGYYFTTPTAPKATLLIPGGYDSTVEEQYPLVNAALSRGYDVLTFDGPGQGHVLRRYGLTMRPDFEKAYSPILDWMDINARNHRYIGIGRSFGGYLVPRAACSEQRLSGLICDPAQMNLGTNLQKMLNPEVLDWLNTGNKEQVDLFFSAQFSKDPMKAFYFYSRMSAHGLHSVFDYLNCLKEYTFEDHIEGIRCPTLVCDNPHDLIASSSKAFYDALTCEKTYVAFSAQTGAGSHCEVDASAQFERIIFDWLDEHCTV